MSRDLVEMPKLKVDVVISAIQLLRSLISSQGLGEFARLLQTISALNPDGVILGIKFEVARIGCGGLMPLLDVAVYVTDAAVVNPLSAR